MEFIKEHAEGVLKASPVRYVRDATVRGGLFGVEDGGGVVSCVDTGFWVDHRVPLEALARARDGGDWPLGELLDGHEFLLVVEARGRIRSKTSRPDASS